MEFQCLLVWLHAFCWLQPLYQALRLSDVHADVSMRDAASLKRGDRFRFLWVVAQASRCPAQRARHPFPTWGLRARLGTWRCLSWIAKLKLWSCLWLLLLKTSMGDFLKLVHLITLISWCRPISGSGLPWKSLDPGQSSFFDRCAKWSKYQNPADPKLPTLLRRDFVRFWFKTRWGYQPCSALGRQQLYQEDNRANLVSAAGW